MEVLTGLDFRLKQSSISLGKFDGLHRGHRHLLSNIKKKKGLVSTVFTFEMGDMPRIYTQEEKNRILESLGIEREIIFPFREDTKNMSPKDFIQNILVDKLDAKYICVGEDFRFGKNRSGDVSVLQHFADLYGYELEVVKKLTEQQKIISSTEVRACLREGNIEMANRFLGEAYFVSGTVLDGESVGRKIDAPTANLPVDGGKILPRYGVYATITEIDGESFFGVTNVGIKPTVGTFPVGVETNLFQFHKNIYGKKIRVCFYCFLREEKKFGTLEELQTQIESDKKDAMLYLQSIHKRGK